jgi:hypothetical protein
MAEDKKAVTATTPDEKVAAEEKTEKPDTNPGETVPGGRYLVNGVLVDANGKPIK